MTAAQLLTRDHQADGPGRPRALLVRLPADKDGWNPEVSVQSDGLTPGQDYGAYPLMRAYQLGIEIGF